MSEKEKPAMSRDKKLLMKGNEAIAEAAVQSGCRLFFGYPITPSSEIIEYMARRLPEVGGTMVQAESEVSAINMVFGAAGTGARVMTGSSSPGISLKQEGLSYLASNQLPCVVVNIARGGPGLGSLAPSQADYFQATKGGGHGDYRLIVLAPAYVQEAVDLVRDAFDLADLYRNPVMIMADGIIGQMMEPVVFNERPQRDLPPKDWATTGAEGRPRRVISSYALEASVGEKHVLELEKKYRQVADREQRWESFHADGADLVVVAYGTAGRISKTAVIQARREGLNVGLIRPITLWPFPVRAFSAGLGQVSEYLVVEMSMGQMVEDVRLAVNGYAPVSLHSRVGGIMPSAEEVLERIRSFYSGRKRAAAGGASGSVCGHKEVG